MNPRSIRSHIYNCAVAVSFFSALCNTGVAADGEGSGESTPAFVHYCSDGDTCRVKVAGGTIWMNVRLFGIDAPETSKKRNQKKGQPLGDEAKDFLNSLVQNKDVTLVQADLDPYNRPVVEIFVAGKSVNLTMIEKGYAEVYRGKTKRIDRKKFEDAETKAKQDKVGVWGQSNYQSPTDFRKSQK